MNATSPCKKIIAVLVGFGTLAVTNSYAQEATFTTKSLKPETALKAAQAALDSCRKSGYQVAVAVVQLRLPQQPHNLAQMRFLYPGAQPRARYSTQQFGPHKS